VELRGLCSRRERLKVEVNVIKCHAVKRGVRLATVVERKVAGDPSFGRSHGVVGVRIVLFVLGRLPQSLDELSRHAPRPSMLMQILFLWSSPVGSRSRPERRAAAQQKGRAFLSRLGADHGQKRILHPSAHPLGRRVIRRYHPEPWPVRHPTHPLDHRRCPWMGFREDYPKSCAACVGEAFDPAILGT
jgi:hypothetical protein